MLRYSSKTRDELRALAKARGLKRYSALNKLGIVQLLLDNDKMLDSQATDTLEPQ